MDKEDKRKIEEYKKNPMANLADSVNRSKIGDLRELTKGTWRTKIITTFIIIAILASFVLGKFMFFNKGFDITINNNTDITLSGLKVTYEKIAKDIDIPSLSAHKNLKINVLPSENFSENAMRIYYFDNQGSRQEEYIIGYFEKGDSGKIIVNINSVDKDGKLLFKIKGPTVF
jgi:hypothetical protein